MIHYLKNLIGVKLERKEAGLVNGNEYDKDKYAAERKRKKSTGIGIYTSECEMYSPYIVQEHIKFFPNLILPT